MSCWHKTTLLRIPVSALGFKYLREWQEFVRQHEDDLQWEDKVVAVLEARDGTILDVVKKIKPYHI